MEKKNEIHWRTRASHTYHQSYKYNTISSAVKKIWEQNSIVFLLSLFVVFVKRTLRKRSRLNCVCISLFIWLLNDALIVNMPNERKTTSKIMNINNRQILIWIFCVSFSLFIFGRLMRPNYICSRQVPSLYRAEKRKVIIWLLDSIVRYSCQSFEDENKEMRKRNGKKFKWKRWFDICGYDDDDAI